jgi:hypothetical protein
MKFIFCPNEFGVLLPTKGKVLPDYLLIDGHHRVQAIKELLEEGKIDPKTRFPFDLVSLSRVQ